MSTITELEKKYLIDEECNRHQNVLMLEILEYKTQNLKSIIIDEDIEAFKKITKLISNMKNSLEIGAVTTKDQQPTVEVASLIRRLKQPKRCFSDEIVLINLIIQHRISVAYTNPNTTLGKKIRELNTLCKNHDWFYDYSDDGLVRRSGNADHDRIVALATSLGERGLRLYNAYKDINFGPQYSFEWKCKS